MNSKKVRVGIAHPRLGRGGSEARALWAIEALKDNYDISLITAGTVELEQLNTYYGTSLRPDDFTIRSAPLSFLLNLISPGDALRGAYYQRFCRKVSAEFDLLISTYNICDFGVPAIQCLADFCWDEDVRLKYDPPPAGARGLFHRNMILRKAYLRLAEKISDPSGRNMFSGEDLILANSKWTAALVKDKYNIEVPVLYPPVAENFPGTAPQDREKGFVCIGRISPEKRIERIIEILKAVRLRGHDVHLHVIGNTDGSAYADYIKKICHADSAWISLEGPRFGEEKMKLLSGHLFGIHGRQAEAFGIAVAEMVKAGCLTFVPSEGGQAEIVDHPALIYQSTGDAAEKIDAVLRDNCLQARLVGHLRGQGEKFSVSAFMSGLREAVEYFRSGKKHN